MTALVLYPLLCAALYYLAAHALITRWLWSRYPDWLDGFLSCAACSGFWYGAALAAFVGRPLGLDLLGLSAAHWATIPLVALASVVWTPLVAWALLRALGSSLAEEPRVWSDAPPPAQRVLVELTERDRAVLLRFLRASGDRPMAVTGGGPPGPKELPRVQQGYCPSCGARFATRPIGGSCPWCDGELVVDPTSHRAAT